MSLSVWSLSYRKPYYFKHPIKFIKEIFYNMRAAYRRARYGWDYRDAWDFCSWLIEVIPPMLRHIADKGSAWPGENTRWPTPEEWEDWLHSMADVLESVREENWMGQNKYEAQWHKYLFTKLDSECKTTTLNETQVEKLQENYFNEERRLEAERQRILQEAFKELAENLDYIWD